MRLTHLCIAAFALASIGCASKPTPVVVTGDTNSLAGKWSGEYSSPVTGRSGSIVFNLSPAGDAASGDVIMIPREYGKALLPYDRGGMQMQTPGTPSQVLTIKLVRVSGDNVSGVLDPYRDPQCDCPVETTFNGTLSGDTIEGTFSTRGREPTAPQTGTWRVKRAPR